MSGLPPSRSAPNSPRNGGKVRLSPLGVAPYLQPPSTPQPPPPVTHPKKAFVDAHEADLIDTRKRLMMTENTLFLALQDARVAKATIDALQLDRSNLMFLLREAETQAETCEPGTSSPVKEVMSSAIVAVVSANRSTRSRASDALSPQRGPSRWSLDSLMERLSDALSSAVATRMEQLLVTEARNMEARPMKKAELSEAWQRILFEACGGSAGAADAGAAGAAHECDLGLAERADTSKLTSILQEAHVAEAIAEIMLPEIRRMMGKRRQQARLMEAQVQTWRERPTPMGPH